MTSQETLQPKKRKRGPKPTGQGTPIQVRLHPEQLANLDNWIANQSDQPSRPEAIRRLIRLTLDELKAD